jgi:hypothetical protein
MVARSDAPAAPIAYAAVESSQTGRTVELGRELGGVA